MERKEVYVTTNDTYQDCPHNHRTREDAEKCAVTRRVRGDGSVRVVKVRQSTYR